MLVGMGISTITVVHHVYTMLTGCQLNEILTLRWEDVDLKAAELRLRDSKTGARMVPLSRASVSVLSPLPRPEDRPWVIVGKKPGTHLTDLQHPWRRITTNAWNDYEFTRANRSRTRATNSSALCRYLNTCVDAKGFVAL